MRTVRDINGVLEQKIMGWGIAGQGESSLYKRYLGPTRGEAFQVYETVNAKVLRPESCA